MPQHTHALTGATAFGSTSAGDSSTPLNNYISLSPKVGSGPNATNLKSFVTPATAGSPVNIAGNPTIANSGGSQPFGILQPSLVINYSIATQGIFPSRQ
jgi:microcystin-dependent protein